MPARWAVEEIETAETSGGSENRLSNVRLLCDSGLSRPVDFLMEANLGQTWTRAKFSLETLFKV
jgi:hypothetical protein